FGQPVLDLACGTGRVLVPLLKEGVQAHGCDLSADMLRLCRARAEREGLAAKLYEQPMHRLDLPQRYQTILICSSFGLAGSHALDQDTLRRCHTHLEDGGALVLNIEAEYAFPGAWAHWTAAGRHSLPEPWPEEDRRRVTADGIEYRTAMRTVALDPLAQSYEREMRLEKWRDGRLLARETRSLRGQMYFKNELMLMLEKAGFGQVTVLGDYSDQPATTDHAELLFVAERSHR
ncbi:MAG TPA: class I SAM-dependent methyltransferase, partial [Desulfurivibrionaceae bacterium]|nr:class I SAM-dependent methyltransferase [Desulfurivibrionaceae bacterium]